MFTNNGLNAIFNLFYINLFILRVLWFNDILELALFKFLKFCIKMF